MKRKFLCFTLMLLMVLRISTTAFASTIVYYDFGQTTFSTYIWINGGKYFTNPHYLTFEVATQGPFAVDVYDKDGKLYDTYSFQVEPTFWLTADFDDIKVDYTGKIHPGLPNGSYKFRFRNLGSQSTWQKIKSGSLMYEN